MAKALASTALLLALNLLFFTLVTSNNAPCPQSSPPKSQKHHHKHCPRDALKFGVCSDVLNGLAGVVKGTPPKTPCCSLLDGLIDLEASVCLCTAIKANILGINLNLPVSLSLVLNFCGKKTPSSFQCA